MAKKAKAAKQGDIKTKALVNALQAFIKSSGSVKAKKSPRVAAIRALAGHLLADIKEGCQGSGHSHLTVQ